MSYILIALILIVLVVQVVMCCIIGSSIEGIEKELVIIKSIVRETGKKVEGSRTNENTLSV